MWIGEKPEEIDFKWVVMVKSEVGQDKIRKKAFLCCVHTSKIVLSILDERKLLYTAIIFHTVVE